MNIRRATLDRVEQYLVDETHHRRVFNVVSADFFVLLLFAGDIEIFEIEIIIGEITHRRVDRFEGFDDAFFKLVLLDHHRVDAQACLELDVVDGLQVGRVSDAKEQSLAALDQRQYAVLVEQFLVHRPNYVQIDFDRVEIQKRHAEFVRGSNSDRARIRQILIDQIGDQRSSSLSSPTQWLREAFPRLSDHPGRDVAEALRDCSVLRLLPCENNARSFLGASQSH